MGTTLQGQHTLAGSLTALARSGESLAAFAIGITLTALLFLAPPLQLDLETKAAADPAVQASQLLVLLICWFFLLASLILTHRENQNYLGFIVGAWLCWIVSHTLRLSIFDLEDLEKRLFGIIGTLFWFANDALLLLASKRVTDQVVHEDHVATIQRDRRVIVNASYGVLAFVCTASLFVLASYAGDALVSYATDHERLRSCTKAISGFLSMLTIGAAIRLAIQRTFRSFRPVLTSIFSLYAAVNLLYPFVSGNAEAIQFLALLAFPLKLPIALTFVLLPLQKASGIRADKLLRDSLENGDIAQCRVNSNGYIEDCNSVCVKLLGETAEELCDGKHEIPFQRQEYKEDLKRLLNGLPSSHLPSAGKSPRLALNRQNNTPIIVEAWWAPIKGIRSHHVMFRDVTEEEEKEKQQEHRKKRGAIISELNRALPEGINPASLPDGVWNAVAEAFKKAFNANAAVLFVVGRTTHPEERRLLSVRGAAGLVLKNLSAAPLLLQGETEEWATKPHAEGSAELRSPLLELPGPALKGYCWLPLHREDKSLYGAVCIFWEHEEPAIEAGKFASKSSFRQVTALVDELLPNAWNTALDVFALLNKERKPRAYLELALKKLRSRISASGLSAMIADTYRDDVIEVSEGAESPKKTCTNPVIEYQEGSSRVLLPITTSTGAPLGALLCINRQVESRTVPFSEFDELVLKLVAQTLGFAAELLLNADAHYARLDTFAHDSQAPVAAMQGSVEVLQRQWDTLTQSKRERLLRHIQRECTSLKSAVANLQFAKKSSRPRLNKTLLYSHVLEPAIEEARLLADALSLHDNFSVEDYSLIPALYLDQGKMIRVFSNLLINAVKYSKRDEPSYFRVIVGFRVTNQHFVVDIKDWGIGIRPGMEESIFEEGLRSKEAQDITSDGFGLGLTIARRLVQEHEGDLRLTNNSQPTVFSVFFPKTLAHAPSNHDQSKTDNFNDR